MRSRRRVFVLLLAAAVAFACCLPHTSRAQHVSIGTVTDLPMNPGKAFQSYSLTDAGLHAELLYEAPHDSTPGEFLYTVWKGDGPRRFDPDRSIPIERRMQLFVPLFRQFLATEKPPANATFSLLVYGFFELDDRLATLAVRDPNWDLRLGKPKKKFQGYDYYAQLLENGHAAREIEQAFQPFHYRVTMQGGSMENLWVLPYSKLSADRRAVLNLPLRGDEFVPARISVFFTVKGAS